MLFVEKVHTDFKKKKNIIIMNSNEPVSPKLFPVNLVHHCSAGPTTRGGPRLVRLINFFFFLKKTKIKQ